VTGYALRWFTCPQTVTHPSTNPAVHGLESNSQPVDHKSDALTITLSSHVELSLLLLVRWEDTYLFIMGDVLLQSALRLTEVLKEREAQIELKKLREASVCGDNKDTQAKLRADYEESLRIGLEEKQKARDAKIKTVEYQKAQYEALCDFLHKHSGMLSGVSASL